MTKLRAFALAAIAILLAGIAYAAHSDLNPSITYILKSEGGYTNDPRDPGGPTNFGITIYDVRLYVKKNATAADVRALTKDQAIKIYESKYWDALDGDALPAGMDYTAVDYGVTSGIARSGRVLRKVLGLPTEDWHITDDVMAALKKRALTAVIRQVNDERSAFLHRLSTCDRFCGGWDRRVASVKAISLKMAGTPADADLIGWKTPVDNAFVRYVPTEPQPGPGKAIASPMEQHEEQESAEPPEAAKPVVMSKKKTIRAKPEPQGWFARTFGHEAPQ